MIIVAALAGSLFASTETRLLFFGNSHTWTHNVPAMVRSLTLHKDRMVTVDFVSCGFLNELDRPDIHEKIRKGKWTHVVLQAAKLSSSHKYRYNNDGAVNLAKLARKSGAKALFFAEWPRRGWDETDFISREYGLIAKPASAAIVPVCKAWDDARRRRPNLELWAQDGNHSALPGAYLAACTLSLHITGDLGAWRPQGLGVQEARVLQDAARSTVP